MRQANERRLEKGEFFVRTGTSVGRGVGGEMAETGNNGWAKGDSFCDGTGTIVLSKYSYLEPGDEGNTVSSASVAMEACQE